MFHYADLSLFGDEIAGMEDRVLRWMNAVADTIWMNELFTMNTSCFTHRSVEIVLTATEWNVSWPLPVPVTLDSGLANDRVARNARHGTRGTVDVGCVTSQHSEQGVVQRPAADYCNNTVNRGLYSVLQRITVTTQSTGGCTASCSGLL